MSTATLQSNRRDIARQSENVVYTLLDHLQRTLATSKRPAELILNEFRHLILNQQEYVRTCVSAIRDVVKSRKIDVDPELWQGFFDIAPEAQNLPDRSATRKLRALASLTVIWGSEVTHHYGWELKDTRYLQHLRRCALSYPDWATFSNIANIVMIRRHEHSLSNARTPQIGYTARGPREPSPLTLQDLDVLSSFATNENESDSRHGRPLLAQCVNDETELSRVDEWSSSADGRIMIRGQALRSLKPHHYHQFLVQKDKFGMLCPSDVEQVTGTVRSKKRASDDISPLRAKAQRVTACRPSFPNLPAQKDRPSCGATPDYDSGQASGDESETDSAIQDLLPSSVSREQSQSPTPDEQTEESTVISEVQASTSESGAEEQPDSSRPSRLPSEASNCGESLSGTAVSNRSNVENAKAAASGTTLSEQNELRSSPKPAACDAAVSVMQSATSDLPCVTTNNHRQTGSPHPHQVLSEREAQPMTSNVRNDAEIVLAVTDASSLPSNEDNLHLSTSASSDLHDETVAGIAVFPTGLSDTQKGRLQHWAEVAHSTEAQAPHSVLKQWLNPVRYASICTVADSGATMFASAGKYDVLKLTWDDFKRQVSEGKVFETPLLIEEVFADAGEFSASSYAELLERTFAGMEINVRHHQSEPQALPISEAAQLIRTPPNTVLPNAPNFLDLDSLTNAIKPGLTRLSRFRLLDRIVRRAKAMYSKQTGKRTFSTPFDVDNSRSFEILGLRGAFSGAHMDALGGTWLRNLFGTKLWMIVPQYLMQDEDWAAFGREGASWNPGTKSRAIILRPGDVFFMPPGARVIHAVLTLETSLMDGGMVWDDETLLPLLRTLHWIGKNQSATNEALPYQLAEVLSQLESYLATQDAKTLHGSSDEISRAIQDLRDLGCQCGACEETCPCSEQSRRCTPLCSEHVVGTGKACFEEPYSEDSDDVGSLFCDD